jgi:hypothetical protein
VEQQLRIRQGEKEGSFVCSSSKQKGCLPVASISCRQINEIAYYNGPKKQEGQLAQADNYNNETRYGEPNAATQTIFRIQFVGLRPTPNQGTNASLNFSMTCLFTAFHEF